MVTEVRLSNRFCNAWVGGVIFEQLHFCTGFLEGRRSSQFAVICQAC